MMENVNTALTLLWQGMSAIFVVLGVIALLVAGLKKIDAARKK